MGAHKMGIEAWDEIRTAFQVARLGTVSGAAEVLGVHHATVIRHVDALERRLGVRLFQRHARGYTPTEAGRDLLRVAQTTEDQFTQFASRMKGGGAEITGELVVTSIADLAPLVTPVLAKFQRTHPGLSLRYLTDTRLFRLEYGEAHVAIRAGAAPDQPDNVVQPFVQQSIALYASRDYIARRGSPTEDSDLAAHQFVGPDDARTHIPFFRWLLDLVPFSAITFRTLEMSTMLTAIQQGAGIGFVPVWMAEGYDDLVQVMPPRPDWGGQIWLVTHVDLHRTNKVQALLAHLKQEAKNWPEM